jgi:hypothetical protein
MNSVAISVTERPVNAWRTAAGVCRTVPSEETHNEVDSFRHSKE